MIKANGKKIIAFLLLLSCIVSGIILAASPEYHVNRLNLNSELDSLIHIQFYNAGIQNSQIREYSIEVDSAFTRKTFRVEVPSRFHKTLFHFRLHKNLYPYGVTVPGRIHFPERDMDLYIYSNETVLRTIRFITNNDIDSTFNGES